MSTGHLQSILPALLEIALRIVEIALMILEIALTCQQTNRLDQPISYTCIYIMFQLLQSDLLKVPK